MYTVNIEKMCGCVKQDKELELPQSLKTAKDAELTALKIANRMNKDYCKKHRFYVEQDESSYIIRVELSCDK